MTVEYSVIENQTWSDSYQSIGAACDDTEDFYEALKVFLETCNLYLDGKVDDNYWGDWRAIVESRCEFFGKTKDETYAQFLGRQSTIESMGVVYIELESSEESIMEFSAFYDADDGIWLSDVHEGLMSGEADFDKFYNEHKSKFKGINADQLAKIKNLWRFEE